MKKAGLKGSITLRLFVISLLFLILPLIIFALIMQRSEVEVKKRDVLQALSLMVEGQKELIEDYLGEKDDYLSQVATALKSKKISLKSAEIFLGKGFTLTKELPSSTEKYYFAKKIDGQYLLFSISPKSLLQMSEVIKNPKFATYLTIYDREGKILIAQEKKGREFLSAKSELPEFGLTLELQTSTSIVFEEMKHHLYLFGIFLLFILGFGGIGTFLFMLRYSKPLQRLKEVMEEAGKGDLKVRYQKDALGFEINRLGDEFNAMIEELDQNIVKNVALTTELNLGREVQKSLLPLEIPSKDKFHWTFIPAKEVGGDFFEIIEKDSLLLTIADGSGKGVFACLYSLTLRSILRSMFHQTDKLSEIIEKSNELFCQDTKDSGAFVTAWLALYHPQTGELEYSSCGHLPAILKRKNKEVIELTTEGMVLGVLPFVEIETKKIKLEPGDSLILYTDGVTEAENQKGEFFGRPRLINLVKESDARDLSDEIAGEVKKFSGTKEANDDITILVLTPK